MEYGRRNRRLRKKEGSANKGIGNRVKGKVGRARRGGRLGKV